MYYEFQYLIAPSVSGCVFLSDEKIKSIAIDPLIEWEENIESTSQALRREIADIALRDMQFPCEWVKVGTWE